MCEFNLVPASSIECGDYIRYEDYIHSYHTDIYEGFVKGLYPVEKSFMFRTRHRLKILIDNNQGYLKGTTRLAEFYIDPKKYVWKKN